MRESKDRVRSAILNSHFTFPDRRITVNLAPADLPKEGGRFDLPIALGILAASGQLPQDLLNQHEFLGELALDGCLRAVPGAIPAASAASRSGRQLVVPAASAPLAALAPNSRVIPAGDLLSLCAHLNGSRRIDHCPPEPVTSQCSYPDLGDVAGQPGARRALEIAASGNHNLLFFGPPGTGKTLLASRLPGILPPPSPEEALTLLALRHFFDPADTTAYFRRPFRAPHHTISDVALVGGGSNPLPGEISLAHNGVLFLDELPEFKRTVLEVMRQPMEERKVTISRAKLTVDYPASFMLIASMNPCPCGYYNHPEKECVCAPGVVQRYLNKISGPLLDRIDLHVEVTPVGFDELTAIERPRTGSQQILERVIAARKVQEERYLSTPDLYANAQMPSRMVREICTLNQAGQVLLQTAMKKLQLSARAYDRILKVSRTIADLGGSPDIKIEHLAEAIQYRSLDRENWVG